MNDQLQQALATILNKSMDALQAGVTFLQAELPDVIRQLLVWHATLSGIKFAAHLILLVAALALIPRVWRWAKSDAAEDWGPLCVFPFVVLGAGLLAGTAGLFSNLTWLQILIAPKIYLIEYAARLVTK